MIETFRLNQTNKFRNRYRFSAQLPNETDFILVSVKMSKLLSEPLFRRLLNELNTFKKALKNKERREQQKAKFLHEKFKQEKLKKKYEEEYQMSQYYTNEQLFGAEQLETDETFAVNKNDPTKYPSLKPVEVKGVKLNQIQEMEMKKLEEGRRRKQEKLERERLLREQMEAEKEKDFPGIFVVKKKKKGKKGGKNHKKRKGKKKVTMLGNVHF